MWMVVREDPTGRLRYQYHNAHSFNPDDCYRFSRGCRSFPDPMYSCSPQPIYPDHHGEVEQYDNVSPDSPVPVYHQIYSAPITGSYIYSSPSTSSSEYQESSIYRDMRYVRRPSYPREIVSPVSSIPNSDSFYYYSRKEPRCPSPDYSPPLRNRVRFQLPDSPVSEGHFVSSIVGEREPRQPVDEDRHISSLEPFSLDPDPSSYSLLRTVNNFNEELRLESSSCSYEQSAPKKSSSSSKLFKNRLFRKSGNKGSAPLPPSSSPYTPSSVRAPSIPLSGGVTPLGIMPHTDKTNSSLGSSLFRKDKGKKKGKNKIRKEDISNPTNFQHKAHVGWDQDSGFSNNVFDSDPMDESIRDIIKAAGQDPSNMSKKTIKFVYDFIDKYQAEEYTETPMAQAPYKTPPPSIPVAQPAIAQWSQPTPPPPPSRLSSHQSSMPPARPPPPPPSYLDSSSRAARPLPQVPSIPSQIDANRPAVVPPPPPPPPPVAPTYNNSSSAPPPPPPPPPPILANTGAVPPPPPPSVLKDLPAPQAARSNLLAEIQAGKKLKSVGEPAEKAGSSNSRGDMMAQIRQGTQLKHVDKMAEEERRKSAAPLSDMGGLAGALAKALEERRVNLGIDDSSDEEDSDDKNEWSD